MFNEISLIFVKEYKDSNGEIRQKKTIKKVRAVEQTVSKSSRESYNEQGFRRYARFKLSLFDDLNIDELDAFTFKNKKYEITDISHDKTHSSTYLEGVSKSRGDRDVI